MALQTQIVPFPEIMGLDTKTDVKQLQPGYLRKAENIVYETLKLIRKRNGYDLLPMGLLEGGNLSDIVKLAKYKTELLALKNGALYSYSPARMKWSNKGTLYSAETVSDVVYKSAGTQNAADGIVVDNFKVFVWADSSLGVRYSVQDLNTNSYLISNGTVEAGGERPVVAAISGDVYVLYGVGAAIKYRRFSILEPQTLGTAVTIASNRHLTDGLIDVRTAGTAIACAYNADNAGDDLVVFKINSDGSVSSLIGVNGESASDALNVYVDANSRIIVTYSNGTQIKVTIYAFNLNAAILTPTVVDTEIVSTCTAISNGSAYQIYYEVNQATANFIKQTSVTLAGTVAAPTVFCRSVGLAADAFSWGGTTYVPTVFESSTQSTYFLLNSDGILTTKWANQIAASVITTGVLPSSVAISSTEILMASLFRNRLETAEGNTFFSTTGVGSVSINFEPTYRFSNAELAAGLHICAGVLKYYDGATVTEHGFNMFPEGLVNQATATTGGFLTNGNRGYKAIYKWTDNNGRDHRSAPTLIDLNVILSGGTTTQTSTIRVPTLRVTDKANAVIELYRTEDAGTTYYKVTNDLSPVLNNKTVDYIDIVDTISDVTLISKESLYTTGDILENVPAPAAFQVCTYNGDRLVVVGEDGHRVFFSKEVNEESPVEFTDTIYRDVSPTGGPITSIINMGSKLVIFETDACYFVQGEGPLNTGVQDSLTKPEVVASDIGAVSPDSVVLTPSGLIFKSRKGLWFLNGGLSMSYIGDKVEAFNGQTVTAASIIGELNQIRFLLSEERALVYNYNLNKWATFENHGGQSSVVIENDYWYLREDGAIYQENRSSFSDASSPIKLRFETGWTSPAELQGFARIRKALILATWKSSHKLRMRIAYDFIEAYTDQTIIDPSQFVDAPLYGADSPYGSGSPYGGNGALYEERVDFAQQKCTAIKFLIEDIQGSPSEGLTISGITFQIGVKQGTQKLGVANQTGTE